MVSFRHSNPAEILFGQGQIAALPDTGSESKAVSLISHAGRRLKQAARPRFAILDPSTMESLSRRQLENGTVDAFIHVLEQYLTCPVNAPEPEKRP